MTHFLLQPADILDIIISHICLISCKPENARFVYSKRIVDKCKQGKNESCKYIFKQSLSTAERCCWCSVENADGWQQ